MLKTVKCCQGIISEPIPERSIVVNNIHFNNFMEVLLAHFFCIFTARITEAHTLVSFELH